MSHIKRCFDTLSGAKIIIFSDIKAICMEKSLQRQFHHRNIGKRQNRVCCKAYRVLPTEDYKTVSGRKPMQRHQLSPTNRIFSKRKAGINENEFLPKRGFFASFGKNSTLVICIYE
jgi:hypothetical protein